MFRLPSLALASVAAALTLGLAPTANAGVAPPVNAYNCSPGYFCIYSEWNGGGTRCQWSQERKANTADDCSFIQQGHNVRSVRNSTGHRVQYYTGTNYNSRVGSTPAGQEGNLQGSYQIRSFKPQ
ncbi:peptidase inhibitor family I36 protein [Streptomyces sp. NBC_00237]|uniref:peptidase inhibitor family I36 protein n=1 Tax=Streptomyces sp. NBC_00237 TaxID=2975687 RepID=UPI002253C413|nr:peptidase inhibitor family I36 protein [Streptomyces sp. NBC_00237]MCX5206111.1 peptidase inhibitor family I36 protein [Streptomyces sp. NBC_00237]